MSTSPSPESELDLEKLFLPAWAQDSPAVNRYANFSGEDRRERKFDDRPRSRPPRRDQPRGAGPGGPRGDRGRGPGSDRGPRPGGPRDHGAREPRREMPAPLPL